MFVDSLLIEDFISEKADEFGLSNKQKNALSDLVYALKNYDDNPEIYNLDHPLMIDELRVLIDPKWHEIQKMAQKVLSIFGKIKYEPEDKEWWLRFILNCISDYSDIEKQKRMWVDKSEFFWSTPLDMFESLFDRCEFDYFMEEYAEKFGLNEEQIAVLSRFKSQLNKTLFKIVNSEKVFDNPDWNKIQMLAYEARNVLVASLASN